MQYPAEQTEAITLYSSPADAKEPDPLAQYTQVKGEDLWNYVHSQPENTRDNPYKIWVTSPIPEASLEFLSEYWTNNPGSFPDWSRYFEVYYSNPDILFIYINTLTKAEIADGVTSIVTAAFSACTGLPSVNIPKSVTSIRELAFADCTNLTSVTFEDDNNKWEKVESSENSTPVTGDDLKQALTDGRKLTKNTN